MEAILLQQGTVYHMNLKKKFDMFYSDGSFLFWRLLNIFFSTSLISDGLKDLLDFSKCLTFLRKQTRFSEKI